jgi:hypothetical protein
MHPYISLISASSSTLLNLFDINYQNATLGWIFEHWLYAHQIPIGRPVTLVPFQQVAM